MQGGLKELFYATVALFNEAAFAVDQRGHVVACNDAFEHLFGLAITGPDVLHADQLYQAPGTATWTGLSSSADGDPSDTNKRFSKGDGGWFLGWQSVAPIYSRDGDRLGSFVLVREAGDLDMLEAAIQSFLELPTTDIEKDTDCLFRLLDLGCLYLKADHGSLGRYDRDDYIIEHVAGPSPFYEAGDAFESASLSDHDANDRSKGRCVPRAELLAFHQRIGGHACLVVPVSLAGRAYGALTFACRSPRHAYPSAWQELLLRLLAIWVGTCLEGQVTRRALYKASEELERFAHITSHDLQEPLRRIVTYSQLLADDHHAELSSQATGLIDVIQTGGKRMHLMLNDLLAYATLSQEMTQTFEPVDMTTVFYQALDDLERPHQACGAQMDVPHLPLVWGHASLLRTLCGQLLSNAIKFTGPERPMIDVSLQDSGHFWQFAVSDHGIGIEPRFAEKVFDIFLRLHPRDDFSGTGTGLAVCKQIVEGYGGSIWIDKRYHAGTRVLFTLPKDRKLANPIAGSVYRWSSGPSQVA